VHLLEANTPLVVIRDFLGHVDINTTGIYARASMKMKREALENAEETAPKTSISTASWKSDKNLMNWLQSL
jgi:site-specific recombinase XerD